MASALNGFVSSCIYKSYFDAWVNLGVIFVHGRNYAFGITPFLFLCFIYKIINSFFFFFFFFSFGLGRLGEGMCSSRQHGLFETK